MLVTGSCLDLDLCCRTVWGADGAMNATSVPGMRQRQAPLGRGVLLVLSVLRADLAPMAWG